MTSVVFVSHGGHVWYIEPWVDGHVAGLRWTLSPFVFEDELAAAAYLAIVDTEPRAVLRRLEGPP